jgi:hypothetical protein
VRYELPEFGQLGVYPNLTAYMDESDSLGNTALHYAVAHNQVFPARLPSRLLPREAGSCHALCAFLGMFLIDVTKRVYRRH